jgi:hypothetical protein
MIIKTTAIGVFIDIGFGLEQMKFINSALLCSKHLVSGASVKGTLKIYAG